MKSKWLLNNHTGHGRILNENHVSRSPSVHTRCGFLHANEQVLLTSTEQVLLTSNIKLQSHIFLTVHVCPL